MKIYKGNVLSEYVNDKLKKLYREGVKNSRFCKSNLDDFLLNNKRNNVCSIYGLRRTGKTTMMLQSMRDLDCNNTLFIQCTNNDNYLDIEKLLNNAEQQYIFIDEISKVENFMLLASSLSDDFFNKKIVITGTDSSSLLFAKEGELFDRVYTIPTTYVSFAEYNYLFDKDIEDYIRYGGTLTDGHKYYNGAENIDEYTNSSIVCNIQNTVKIAKYESNYKKLYDLYLNDILTIAINKTIEKNARNFSLKVINSLFIKSNNFGSAKDLLIKDRNDIPDEDINIISNWKDHTEICEFISKKLQMESKDSIKEDDIILITNFLIKLNVLIKLPDGDIVFTQPGMQHCFAQVLIENIVYTEEYQKLYPNTQRLLLEKIEQDSIGRILENVIKTDVLNNIDQTRYLVGKVENYGKGEFDMYIIDKETNNASVFEIKRSSKVVANQYQHLINDELCSEFELLNNCSIIKKAVIYQGETITLENNISYINVSDFLLNLEYNIGLCNENYKSTDYKDYSRAISTIHNEAADQEVSDVIVEQTTDITSDKYSDLL